MTTNSIRIKDQGLGDIIGDVMDMALAIDRPNCEKICQFVFNLAQNGGNKTQAAFDAGYGGEKDKDGNKRSEKDRKHIASVEAARLLGNARILAIYEALKAHRFLSRFFVKNLRKEDVIHIMYQNAMDSLTPPPEKNSKHAALKEIAALMGFYSEESKDNLARKLDEEDEMRKAPDTLALIDKAANAVRPDKRKMN